MSASLPSTLARSLLSWTTLASALAFNPAQAQTVVTLQNSGSAPRANLAHATPAASASANSIWLHDTTARLVVGYSDNVLWSAQQSDGRGFAQSEVEALAWRSSPRKWEASAMLSGEVRRYASPLPEASGEQRWLARGELAARPYTPLRLAVVAQGFYQDQVYDLSADRAERFVAKLRVGGLQLAFQPRLSLPRGWDLEPIVQERVTDYFDFTEDYSETRTGARLRWRRETRWEASAAIYDQRRDYRDRVNYTIGGRPLAGTELRFDQTIAEARLAWNGRKHGLWRISSTLQHVANRDRGSGFFDYDQQRVRADIVWQNARWEIELGASFARYEYLIQTVGMGIAPPARTRDDVSTRASVEYTLTPRWRALARCEWDRSRTNELHASCHVTAVSAGIAWNH